MIKEGMYVEYSEYDSKGDIVKKIGQIVNVEEENVEVLSHEFSEKGHILSYPSMHSIKTIKRADIRAGAVGRYANHMVTIIRKSDEISKEGYTTYYCAARECKRSFLVNEQDIKVQSNDIEVNLLDMVLKGEFCDYEQFLARYHILDYYSSFETIPEEYDSIIGKRIELMEHQMETVKEVTKNIPIRAILADEVGLGKTIEALAVLDYSLKTRLCKKVLIIVPEQLKYQWFYETKTKFNMQVDIFTYFEFKKANFQKNICIISDVDICHYYEDFNWKQWDFVVCDEVHKMIRSNKMYSIIYRMCKMTTNVLLLSATPLLQRGKEMYRLLKLYNPEYYTRLTLGGFQKILDVRNDVIDRMNKVSFGFKMKQDMSRALKCFYTFKDIANEFEDIQLKQLLSKIDESDETTVINIVKLAFAYLEQRYEISPKYIRHRRNDILDVSSKRCLYDEVEFYFDSFENNDENAIYQMMRDELEICIKKEIISVENIMKIGSALFSSYAALHRVFVDNELYELMPQTYRLNYHKQLREARTLSNSRLDSLISYLKNNSNMNAKKTVIFTDFYETAELVSKRIAQEFGENRVTLFTTMKGTRDLTVANNSFKNIETCWFMVCDKSGAEGKNLQFADYIIHFDTPWIPTDLEQRIGRLDRIGRGTNRPVYNIVIYSKDTIEEDLIKMCNIDLNIYEESLSGIEIVFDQITLLIKNSIKENALLGFDIVGEEVKELKHKCEEAVQQEYFEQICLQASSGYSNQTRNIINVLTGDKYVLFIEGLCNYYMKKGYEVNRIGEEISFEGLGKKSQEKITGTFSVQYALNEENVPLLSVNTPFVRDICLSAKADNKMRVTAIKVCDAGFNWSGFISLWQLQLNMREYYKEQWDDFIEKIPNMYISEQRMLLADVKEGEDYAPEYLLQTILKSKAITVMSLEEIEEVLDNIDLEYEINESIVKMRKSFSTLISYKFDFEQLKKDVEKAKQDLLINHLLKTKVQNSKKRVEALIATQCAMKKNNCCLDSIMFVRFEK